MHCLYNVKFSFFLCLWFSFMLSSLIQPTHLLSLPRECHWFVCLLAGSVQRFWTLSHCRGRDWAKEPSSWIWRQSQLVDAFQLSFYSAFADWWLGIFHQTFLKFTIFILCFHAPEQSSVTGKKGYMMPLLRKSASRWRCCFWQKIGIFVLSKLKKKVLMCSLSGVTSGCHKL